MYVPVSRIMTWTVPVLVPRVWPAARAGSSLRPLLSRLP